MVVFWLLQESTNVKLGNELWDLEEKVEEKKTFLNTITRLINVNEFKKKTRKLDTFKVKKLQPRLIIQTE